MGRLADQFAAAQARGTAVMDMTVTRGGVSSTVTAPRRDVDDCGFPKRPCEGQGHGTASRAGGGTRDLVCADCGRAFTQRTRRGTAPKRCPECKRARRNALRRAKGAGQAGRVAQVQALTCADCGRTFERPSPHGPLPSRCPECRKARERGQRLASWAKRRAAGLVMKPKAHAVSVARREAARCRACGAKLDCAGRMGPIPRYCPECRKARERESKREQMRRKRQDLEKARECVGLAIEAARAGEEGE